ncbi:unnamed protein product [Prorocentrum cordatum]|uniref:Uncharacterized protein n=1 Tax=Prorocentrum cordatum TaxID=2364126 RepID=A0ABN9R5Q4_9DINO|nr:unnamed protein product [Polarella glacialis]
MSHAWFCDRLEMNDVIDPGRYLDEIRQSSISVCFRRDEVRCNPRRCVYGCKVHLPHFEMQKSTKGKGKGKDGKDWHKSYEWEDWKKPYREPFEGSRHHQDTEARWEDHRGERRGEDRRDWNGRDWNAEEVESEHAGEYGSRRRVRKLDTQRLNLTDDMSRRDMLDPGPYEEGKGRADDWEAHGGPRRRDERWASDHLGVELAPRFLAGALRRCFAPLRVRVPA